MAHVTFANNASAGGVFWNIVWTFQNAILAADTLIIQVPDNSSGRVLLIGQHRATLKARRLETMMARARDGLLIRLGRRTAMQQPDRAPGLIFV